MEIYILKFSESPDVLVLTTKQIELLMPIHTVFIYIAQYLRSMNVVLVMLEIILEQLDHLLISDAFHWQSTVGEFIIAELISGQG